MFEVSSVRVFLSAGDGDEHRVVRGVLFRVHLLDNAFQWRVAPSDVEHLIPFSEGLGRAIGREGSRAQQNLGEKNAQQS